MDEQNVEVHAASRPVFTREQKFGYAVVIICGVLAVSLGGFYMSKHVKAPFIVTYTGSRFLTAEEASAEEVAKQKTTDTDGDTISDYDEMKIYGSSPYLVDSDSDGTPDNVEIASNSDPTCARGDTCANETDALDLTNDPVAAALLPTDIAQTANTPPPDNLTQIKTMLESQTPTDVRAMLIDAGADKTKLDAMTDDEVMSLYANVLAELEKNGGLEQLLAQMENAQTDSGTGADSSSTTTTP